MRCNWMSISQGGGCFGCGRMYLAYCERMYRAYVERWQRLCVMVIQWVVIRSSCGPRLAYFGCFLFLVSYLWLL